MQSHIRSIALLLSVTLAGCASPKVLGTRTSTVTTRNERMSSTVLTAFPSEALPQLPQDPDGSGTTFSGAFTLPQTVSESPSNRPQGSTMIHPQTSFSGEIGLYPGHRWRLGVGGQASKDGPSSLWASLGKGFPVSKAEAMVRVGAGIHRIRAENVFLQTTEESICSESGTCSITTSTMTGSEGEHGMKLFGRIAASLQAPGSGPWLEFQATTGLEYAKWTESSTSTTTTTRMGTEENCHDFLILGPCTHKAEWTEVNSASDPGAKVTATMNVWSVGTGWVVRRGAQQWVAGARWYPSQKAVEATLQWSVALSLGEPARP